MRRYLPTIALLVLSTSALGAPAAAPSGPPAGYGCPDAQYRQFDFWLGKWTVTNTQGGQLAGSSEITALDKGCVILESWTGSNGGTGHSLNVYDQADGKWHQTWVGVTGDQVHYVGAFKNGKMQLLSNDISTPQIAPTIKTMTFEARPDGTVRQSGTASIDGGKTVQSSFDLIYTRVK